jgi:hypothetical protein
MFVHKLYSVLLLLFFTILFFRMCMYSGDTWDFHKSKIEGNTGFYFVRSNNNTIKLWADAYAAAPK